MQEARANDEPIFAYICERDIDLLLVEELRCSRAFQEWLLERIGAAQPRGRPVEIVDVDVKHSVSTSGAGSGESDVVARFQIGSQEPKEVRAYIENKIDADSQKSQAGRYRDRARDATVNESCVVALTTMPIVAHSQHP